MKLHDTQSHFDPVSSAFSKQTNKQTVKWNFLEGDLMVKQTKIR